MSVLIVVAHPDDEVLACGGTAARLAERGVAVRACMLAAHAGARRHRPESEELSGDLLRAQGTLGIGPPILGDFPNIELNTVPHLKLVQFVEAAIAETGADVIITHHPADLNDDHGHVSRACQAAARLFQRRPGVPRLRALYYSEILSSTEWAFPGSHAPFQADTFFELGDAIEKKLAALRCYRGVMRAYPHARSEEVIRGLAAYRGSQAGMHYAEAYQTAFRAIEDMSR